MVTWTFPLKCPLAKKFDSCKPALTLYHTIHTFNHPEKKKKKPFENIVGKAENAGNQHFSFSHNVLYQPQNEYLFLSCIYFVVCKWF